MTQLDNSSKTFTRIDISDLTAWGLTTITHEFKDYLDESVDAKSSRYLHTVLTTFSVESLTGGPQEEVNYWKLLSDDYVSAFEDYKSPKFQGILVGTWNKYRRTVRDTVSRYMTIDPLKAYTCTVENHDTLIINDIHLADLVKSVEEIF